METVLIIYLIGLAIVFFGTLFYLIIDEDEKITYVQFTSWCVFWPFYFLFYIPRVIIEISKFILKVFKQAFNDLTKIYKK